MSNQSAEQSGSRNRIAGLDVARGLALFGIAGNHLMGANTTASWLITRIMADFHAVAFAFLIGSGVQLEYDAAKRRGQSSWPSVLIRAAFLVILGAIVGWWATRVAVILVTLGLLTVVARAVVGLATWALASLTGLIFLGGPLLTSGNVAFGWSGTLYSPDLTDAFRPEAYLSFFVAEPYPFVTWTFYALVGMLYVRLVLKKPRLYWLTTCLAIGGAAIALAIDAATRPRASVFVDGLLTWEAYSGSYVNVASSALVVIAGVTLCCILADGARGHMRSLITVLTAVGQLTLTWYVVHILISDRIMTYLEHLPPHLAYLDIGIWVAQMIGFTLLSALYKGHFRYGPLEAIPRQIVKEFFPPSRSENAGSASSVPTVAPSKD